MANLMGRINEYGYMQTGEIIGDLQINSVQD